MSDRTMLGPGLYRAGNGHKPNTLTIRLTDNDAQLLLSIAEHDGYTPVQIGAYQVRKFLKERLAEEVAKMAKGE